MMKNNKALKKKMKQYLDYEFSLEKYTEEKYLKENSYVIYLDIKTLSDFIEPYSKLEPVLKKEIGEYIERISYDFKTYIPVTIEIKDYFTVEEKEQIKKLIRDYFGLKAGDIVYRMNTNMLKSISLLLVGILFLILYTIFSYQAIDFILKEILSITGSFAIWEFVNSLLMERSSMHLEKLNLGQLLTAEIIFQ